MSRSVSDIAGAIRSRATTALVVMQGVLGDIERRDPLYTCFTRVFRDEALKAAREIDARIAAGLDAGPLAGVPFAVKDLFDVAGLPTTAGAATRLTAAPAGRDARVVARLKAAGAILVGTLNMDEYAYGFATVNAHFGTTRNPADTTRLAGGSSGGSAASVAAGLVPLTLGSDTNVSIRVPASLCGVWGMRPADGALSLDGVFPFAETLDTVGPFVTSADDLALVYDVLAESPANPASTNPASGKTLRVARLGGWFVRNAGAEAVSAIDRVMAHLGAIETIDLDEAEAARSSAFLITAAEGGALHLENLRRHAVEYDPAVRDRLLAGAMMSPAVLAKARAFRAHYRAVVSRLLETYDILLAPSTPVVAPRIDEATILIDGKPASARANLGIYTQPLSLAGIPVVSAPMNRHGQLPIGIQFATAPGREGDLFRLLSRLEREGVLSAYMPQTEAA